MLTEHADYQPGEDTVPIRVDPDPLTEDYREDTLSYLREDTSGGVVDRVEAILQAWSDYGYSTPRVDAVRNAVAEFDSGQSKELDDTPGAVTAIQSIIRLSREVVHDSFGDTVTVYRGMEPEAVRKHGEIDREAGVVTFSSQLLESWTTVEWIAEGYGEVILEREAPVSEVLFYGPLLGGRMSEDEEVTLGGQGRYSISRHQVQGYRF